MAPTIWSRGKIQSRAAESFAAMLGPVWAVSLLAGLMLALNARERDASLHSMRVAGYSVLLAWRMELNSHDLVAIRQGALLHVIGKIGITDSVFRKPGSLTEHEWEEIVNAGQDFQQLTTESVESFRNLMGALPSGLASQLAENLRMRPSNPSLPTTSGGPA